jgi:rhamnose transport system ATP-binding protein
VHQIVNELAAQGLGIILISSDMPEIMAMSDRILVMREGRQMGIFAREDATQEIILTAAMGQNAEASEVAGLAGIHGSFHRRQSSPG